MKEYELEFQEEILHLAKTVEFIQGELNAVGENLSDRRQELVALRQDMWDNTGHAASDFTKRTEMNQYLFDLNQKTRDYTNKAERNETYQRMVRSPYFGRFDFQEEGFAQEKIYLGLSNIVDPQTQEVYVYDWRAPISSIFYQYELGKATYDAPGGRMEGQVFLKRQYKIKDSQLQYFFDSSIQITDNILQEVLSRNASPKMRNIVETIQKEQDRIIRDRDHDLLIVQGAAGSGKTSVALHRIAYLLYQGLSTHLKSQNILILSPNDVFCQYIANVLPELGEENVRQMTFEDILNQAFASPSRPETREQQLETLIQLRSMAQDGQDVAALRRQSIAFKGSQTFVQILERLIDYYTHRLIPFNDVYFNGRVVATKQQIKNRFLNNKMGIPMAKQMKRLEKTLLDLVHPLQKKRLESIAAWVAQKPEHQLEIKSFSRWVAIREAKSLLERIRKFTTVDYRELYAILFNNPSLFFQLAQGLELPADIDSILELTRQTLEKGQTHYEDDVPLLYLKLKVEGSERFAEIHQVVIDEAQDYTPLQYEVFQQLFRNAQFTVLGDIHQSLEKDVNLTLYTEISDIFQKPKSAKLFLKKGYRSTYEINAFTQRILGNKGETESIERHGERPKMVCQETQELLDEAILAELMSFKKRGYESLAVICKTGAEAEAVYHRLLRKFQLRSEAHHVTLHHLQNYESMVEKGIMVIPSYLAKGLEFDAVIVYNADKSHYDSELDRKLLYVASTRALHHLVLAFIGEKSPFI